MTRNAPLATALSASLLLVACQCGNASSDTGLETGDSGTDTTTGGEDCVPWPEATSTGTAWTKDFHDWTDFKSVLRLLPLPGGGIGLLAVRGQGDEAETALARHNEDGSTIWAWSRDLVPDSGDSPIAAAVTAEGEIVVVAQASGGAGQAVEVAAFAEEDGAPGWNSSIRTPASPILDGEVADDAAHAITAGAAGQVFVLGHTTYEEFAAEPPETAGLRRWSWVASAQDGVEPGLLWAEEDAVLLAMVSTPDAIYLSGPSPAGLSRTDTRVTKLSSGGEVIWTVILDSAPKEDLRVRAALADGVVLAGAGTEAGDTSLAEQDGILVGLSADGDELWNETHGYCGRDFFHGDVTVDAEELVVFHAFAEGSPDLPRWFGTVDRFDATGHVVSVEWIPRPEDAWLQAVTVAGEKTYATGVGYGSEAFYFLMNLTE